MRFAPLLLALGLATPAHAQYTMKAETHLIDTTVSVHDSAGGLVQGLSKDSFHIVEDGVPQTIRFFAHDAETPLSIGLLIDVSGSQEKFVKEHEKDIETFVAEVLTPRDEAFAVCFGNHLRLVSGPTSSAAALVDGVRRFSKGDHDFPELAPDDRKLGTALFDAIWFGIDTQFSGEAHREAGRRKVLLLMTDGEENSSEHDLLDAIRAAQDANVLVYALRYTDAKPGKLNARDRYGVRVLDHLAAQTGGRVFDVQTTRVPAAFAEIAGELRSLYDIAFQSTNHVRDGKFRKVEIVPERPDLVIRSRVGYYAGKGPKEQPGTPLD